jgi:hypothetical protein
MILFYITQISNLIPYASGKALPWLIVQVDLLIYYFQESEPLSLPPPVSFSPPNAPPISAPLVPMLQLTIPQSDPAGPIHWYIFFKSFVKIDELSP